LFHRGNDTRLPLRSLRTSNGSRGQGGDGPRGCGWQRGSAWWWVQWSGCGGRRAIACSAMHVLVMGCLCVMQTADSSPGTTSPTIDHRPSTATATAPLHPQPLPLARLRKTATPRPCPELITPSSRASCGGRLSRFRSAEQTLAAVTAAVFQPLLHGDGGPYAAPPARRSYGRKAAGLHRGGASVSSTLPT
jgi:hypothetical protein